MTRTKSTGDASKKKVYRSGNVIPRAANGWLLYRSKHAARLKTIERDQRIITRTVAHMWRNLPNDERNYWLELGHQNQKNHMAQHPDYQYKPKNRPGPRPKRKVKRNGAAELGRCETIAKMLLSDQSEEELQAAVTAMGPVLESSVTYCEASSALASSPDRTAVNPEPSSTSQHSVVVPHSVPSGGTSYPQEILLSPGVVESSSVSSPEPNASSPPAIEFTQAVNAYSPVTQVPQYYDPPMPFYGDHGSPCPCAPVYVLYTTQGPFVYTSPPTPGSVPPPSPLDYSVEDTFVDMRSRTEHIHIPNDYAPPQNNTYYNTSPQYYPIDPISPLNSRYGPTAPAGNVSPYSDGGYNPSSW